jgi:DNA-binding NarL/FixJ family response regulator
MKVKEKTDVFIVENSKMFSSWIESELKKIENLNLIGIAQDMKLGLNAILKMNPQIVILDLFLDEGSGLTILQTIREFGLPIKIIVFTNYTFYKAECIKLGSDHFFDKSKEFDEMISTVKLLSEEYLNNF